VKVYNQGWENIQEKNIFRYIGTSPVEAKSRSKFETVIKHIL